MIDDVFTFIRTYYMQHILYSLELIACITGFIYWNKIKGSFWKWFPFYLAIICAVELTGDILNYKEEYDVKNLIYNNFSIPLEFLFFYWLYYRYAAGKKRKQLVILCTSVYIASFIADQIYFKHTNFFFNSFSYCIGNLALLLAIISFFIQFTNTKEIVRYKSSMIFWVSLGALIFYLGSLPFFGLYNLLYKEYYEAFVVYSYIMFICNWLMYLLFTVAFIWGKVK
jgi:hypothetical protein